MINLEDRFPFAVRVNSDRKLNAIESALNLCTYTTFMYDVNLPPYLYNFSTTQQNHSLRLSLPQMLECCCTEALKKYGNLLKLDFTCKTVKHQRLFGCGSLKNQPTSHCDIFVQQS